MRIEPTENTSTSKFAKNWFTLHCKESEEALGDDFLNSLGLEIVNGDCYNGKVETDFVLESEGSTKAKNLKWLRTELKKFLAKK